MKQKFSNEYYLESAPITKAIAHLSIPMDDRYVSRYNI